jgi:hypothetical protein
VLTSLAARGPRLKPNFPVVNRNEYLPLRRSAGSIYKSGFVAFAEFGYFTWKSFLLGHNSIQTTERYLGSEQDLVVAVNDNLGL